MKKVIFTVIAEYDHDEDGVICIESMRANLEDALNNARQNSLLTPDDISCDSLSVSMVGIVPEDPDPTTFEKTVPVIVNETGEVIQWSLVEILEEINRDRSCDWTDYDETDWVEGWQEWVEPLETYTIPRVFLDDKYFQ